MTEQQIVTGLVVAFFIAASALVFVLAAFCYQLAFAWKQCGEFPGCIGCIFGHHNFFTLPLLASASVLLSGCEGLRVFLWAVFALSLGAWLGAAVYTAFVVGELCRFMERPVPWSSFLPRPAK